MFYVVVFFATDCFYDSPSPPQKKTAIFFSACTNVSWLLDMRKVAVKSRSPYLCVFLFAMDYRTMASGLARGTVFQEVRPGAGFKTGDFVKEK